MIKSQESHKLITCPELALRPITNWIIQCLLLNKELIVMAPIILSFEDR